jgi:hypothetical protein
MPYLEYGVFKYEEVKCPKCSWKGLGKELQIEEISESSFIIDFCCPKCGEHIGFTQPPMTSGT